MKGGGTYKRDVLTNIEMGTPEKIKVRHKREKRLTNCAENIRTRKRKKYFKKRKFVIYTKMELTH